MAKANIEAIEGNLPRPLATSIMQHGMKVGSKGKDRTDKVQAILPFTLMQDTSAQVQFAFTHICLRQAKLSTTTKSGHREDDLRDNLF